MISAVSSFRKESRKCHEELAFATKKNVETQDIQRRILLQFGGIFLTQIFLEIQRATLLYSTFFHDII